MIGQDQKIKHIWFDFSETIAFLNKERRDRLRYEAYSQIVGKPINDNLISEFEKLYIQYNYSNAAIFRSLGQSSNFWSDRINSVEPSELYRLTDSNIPNVLKKVREIVPISIFSNIQIEKILTSLNINPDWFTHIISAGMVKEPKPALNGFYKIIELSEKEAQEILYIGDNIEKDIKPAKKVGLQTGLMWSKSNEANYSFEKFQDILNIL